MSSLRRALNRRAFNQLRRQACFNSRLAARPGTLVPTPSKAQTVKVASFSTMSALRSTEFPGPAVAREYDSEIHDMATFVHSYKVDSDLAVRANPTELDTDC